MPLVVCYNGHQFRVAKKNVLYKKSFPRKRPGNGIPEQRLLAAIFGKADADLSSEYCPKCREDRKRRGIHW